MATQKKMHINTNPVGGSAFINITLDQSEIQGILSGNFREAANDIVIDPMAKAMAFASRDGLSWLLTKGTLIAGRTVGATDAAAASLQVAELAQSPFGNGRGYAVYESGYTPANRFIRTGTPPQNRPPIAKIKAWIVAKGIGNFNTNAVVPTSLQGMSSQQYIAQQRAANDPITALAWRIAMGIKKKGTSVWHKPMYPGGQKRFDYVVYAVKKLKMLEQLAAQLQTYFPYMHKTVVGYLKTGKWDKGSAFRRIKIKFK